MSTLTDYLAEVSARAEAATEGPWEGRGGPGFADGGTVFYHQAEHDADYPLPGCFTCGDNHAIYEAGDWQFIAAARTDVPTLLAMVQAVVGLHQPLPVWQWDEAKMEFVLGEDGERVLLVMACSSCTQGDSLERIEDCEWDDGWAVVEWPCPTIQALTTAKEAGR